MAIKDFQGDLKDAAAPDRYPHLTRIRAGDNDGSIAFTFTSPASHEQIHLEAVVSDAHDYPKAHTFFVFSVSENVSPAVIQAIENAQLQLDGVAIHQFLISVDRVVSDALHIPNPQTEEAQDPETDSDLADSDNDMIEDDDFSDLEGQNDYFFPVPQQSGNLQEKLRRDLRAVKAAGYKVGYLGEATGPIIIAVSCRIARLGLSEEAMQAWDVCSAEYLVILIRHPRIYQDLGDILGLGDSAPQFLQLRVGLCDSYKPSYEAALHAFQGSSQSPGDHTSKDLPSETPFRTFFIGEPLNNLLRERFLGIVKLRMRYQSSWSGAECLFHASQGKISSDRDADMSQDIVQDTWKTPSPALLTPDHMVDADFDLPRISLPLLAMQFTLRHFVKCTEFCLVCHCKTNQDFEALKPYVCSNGLCLYQYLALGMGPSLEFEIRSQPYVVDMLVCLAYTRAYARRLEDVPTGLGLRVPGIRSPEQNELSHSPSPGSVPPAYHKAILSLDSNRAELVLLHDGTSRFVVGDWILILDAENSTPRLGKSSWHCRVKKAGESSTHISLGLPICSGTQLLWEKVVGIIRTTKEVHYMVYDKNFDDLPIIEKQDTIVALLDILPSVDEMSQYLKDPTSNKVLSSWKDRISPATLDLLRWIVSSNRSCILQDDENQEHLVTGMAGYIQFRLVQGAPDKEQRFIQAVKANSEPTKSKFPTIFAWHGSALSNWHAILREGLHFKTIVNGRAYGNGVYLSYDFRTSAGYTDVARPGNHTTWPQSELNMKSMVSLNEVVNCTSRFVNVRPHYVVPHLDWIQPRYLFVGTSDQNSQKSTAHSIFYTQDPQHIALGPNGHPARIPLSAINSSRRQEISSGKSRAGMTTSESKRIQDVDDRMSISTTIEDLMVLLSESESESDLRVKSHARLDKKTTGQEIARIKSPNTEVPATDFVPGTLEVGSLSLLGLPQYATGSATKLLQQHLQATLKVQKREKLHELGWYVDPTLITTVYQWIVELHSFEPALPLARDLKLANLTSIVLEIRFPSQFPINPPFVRVIRPRLLEFAQGGGGHVTAGGAMCMELLTNSGWSAVASIESVLLQVRLAITSTDPRPGRLAKGAQPRDYALAEAIQAYKRACMMHGWNFPADMDSISW